MSYNLSINVCKRNRRYYEELDQARGTDVSWPVKSREEALKFARRLREAFSAAAHHPDYAKYAELRDMYEFQARDGWVRAYWMGPRDDDIGSATRPERMELGEAESVMAVVGAAIKFKERADEIYFPNAVLEDRMDKVKLWRWCQQASWKYIDQYDAGLTLTRRQVDPVLLFDPNEGEEV